MTVYPNPATSECRIGWIPFREEEGILEVLDLAGRRMVYRPLTPADALTGTTLLPLTGWPAGTYLVRLITSRHHLSAPLVVNP